MSEAPTGAASAAPTAPEFRRVAAMMLRAKADQYGRDADTLRHMRHADEALIYEAIRDELRKVAAEVEVR